MVKLPVLLEKEPLVEAVFEVRMAGDPMLADLLPGALFAQLDPKPEILRLPTSEIPKPIRATDPNLIFSPLVQLSWEGFTISVGDRSIIVACKLPYPKWPQFKRAILDVASRVSQVGFIGEVERFSLKYVNFISAPTIAEQINKINMKLMIGNIQVTEEHISLQLHRKEGDTLHITSLITGALGNLGDEDVVPGVVVGIDSIRMEQFSDFSAFAEALGGSIESLRQENKDKFFSCLTSDAIAEMGPKYD